MQSFDPYAGAFWGSRDLTLGEFLTRVEGFLRGLRGIDPVFSEFYVLGDRANQELRIDDDFGNFAEVGFARAWDVKDPKHWYTDLDEDGHPTLASHSPVTGWMLSIVTEPEKGRTSRFVYIPIHDGTPSKDAIANGARVAVQHEDSPLLVPEVSERLFRYLIEFWSPLRALVTEDHFREATRNTLTREQLGWLNYRADPGFARYLPDAVHREPLGEGVLFRIGDGRVLTEEDTDEVRTALAIQAAIQNDNSHSSASRAAEEPYRFHVFFEALWGRHDLTLGEFVSRAETFLRGLRGIDPVFARFRYLDDDFANLEKTVLAWSRPNSAPKHWYTNLDEDGHPTLVSHSPVEGWKLSLTTKHAISSASISITDGIQSTHATTDEMLFNRIAIDVIDPFSPLRDPETSERLFKYVVEFWSPVRALVAERWFWIATDDLLTQEQFGWLNYRADPAYVRYLPDTVHHESLGPGVFFRIGDGRVLTEEDTEEVRTTLCIHAALHNDPLFRPYAQAFWGPRDLTLGEFLFRTEEFLRGLTEIDPVFSEFYVFCTRKNPEMRLNDDLGNFAEVGFAYAWDPNDSTSWYTDLDADGQPTLASHSPATGWSLDVVTGPERGRSARFVHLFLREGRQSGRVGANQVTVRVQHEDSPLLVPEVSERLFRYLVEFWNPVRALTTEARFRDAAENTLTREQLGWLNYRADPGYARYLPDTVHRERLGEGVFFRIGDGRVLTEEDTEEVRTGLAIQAAVQNETPPPQAS